MGLFSRPEVVGPGAGSDADRTRIAALEQRVARLEAQLALLTATPAGAVAAAAAAAAPAGAGQPDAWMAEVRALRSAGRTIHAIKLYREHTGVGLKEAKDAVEALPL